VVEEVVMTVKVVVVMGDGVAGVLLGSQNVGMWL